MAHDLAALAHEARREGRSQDAMRIASRALALDPEAGDAGELVMNLMLQPDRQISPELRARLQRSDGEAVRQHARAAVPGYLMVAMFLPIVVWNGVRVWSVTIEAIVVALTLAVAAWDLTRRPVKSSRYMVGYAVINALLLALMTRFVGPLLVIPALVAQMVGSLVTYPALLERKWILIAIILAGFLSPTVIEAFGVLAPTWELNDTGLLTIGYAMRVHGMPTITTVLVGVVAIVVMTALQAARIGNASRAAHHQLVHQAYRLGQLLPVR